MQRKALQAVCALMGVIVIGRFALPGLVWGAEWVDAGEAREEYGIEVVSDPKKDAYDVVVVAVAHDEFKALGEKGIRAFGKKTSVLYDIKYVLPCAAVDDRL